MPIIRFIKNWTLPIAMLAGALSYFIYTGIPALEPTKPYVARFIDILQPALIFAMLFITFCKVNPRELRPCRWHGWLLLIQAGCFALLAGLLKCFPHLPGQVLAEAAMLCMICPTATAAAVVTGKLGRQCGQPDHLYHFNQSGHGTDSPHIRPLDSPPPRFDIRCLLFLDIKQSLPSPVLPVPGRFIRSLLPSGRTQTGRPLQRPGILFVGRGTGHCHRGYREEYCSQRSIGALPIGHSRHIACLLRRTILGRETHRNLLQ